MDKIGIIGVGLIGGSLALDIQKVWPAVTITGADVKESHLVEALELGIIHNEGSIQDILEAQLIILVIPVD